MQLRDAEAKLLSQARQFCLEQSDENRLELASSALVYGEAYAQAQAWSLKQDEEAKDFWKQARAQTPDERMRADQEQFERRARGLTNDFPGAGICGSQYDSFEKR